MKLAAFAALLLISTAPAVLAAEVDPAVLDRLKAVMASQQMDLAWEKVETYDNADGEEVTALINATVKIGDKPTTISAIELSDVVEAEGGWKIGKLAVPSHSVTEDDTSVYLEDIEVTGMMLYPEGVEPPYGGMAMYEGFALGAVEVSAKNKQVFRMADLHVELTPPTAGSPLSFEGAAESFNVDLTSVEDAQSKAVIEAMGYQNLAGFFEMGGTWNPADGRMDLTQYDVTVTNAGTIGLAFSLGGYTVDFLNQLKKMQEQLASNPGGDNSAAGLAMLGLMQQLTFNSAQISFYDDSLTNKVLDYVAKQQKVKPADIANQAKAVVPFMMMQLNDPALTQMVTEAVTKFLDDPKSLVITAEPSSPVPFAVIMAGAMSAPQGLPKQLGLKVTANE